VVAEGVEEAIKLSQSSLTTPSITFADITKTYGDAAFTLSPTSDSAGAFTFTSSNTDVATIEGTTVTIVEIGTTTITAMQATGGTYAETSVMVTLTVNAISPTFDLFAQITKNVGDIPFTMTTPTSNSDGAISYSIADESIATVSGKTITLVSNGSTTITATQSASGNYLGASTGTTLQVFPGGCAAVPCQNDGVCTSEPGGAYSCECVGIYSGDTCNMWDTNCTTLGDTCQNGGTCGPTVFGGECSCPECWSGDRCDEYDVLNCA